MRCSTSRAVICPVSGDTTPTCESLTAISTRSGSERTDCWREPAHSFPSAFFGSGRRALLAGEPGEDCTRSDTERAGKLHGLLRSVSDIAARKTRLIRTLDTNEDPDGAVFSQVRERLVEFEGEREQKRSAIASMEQEGPR